MPDSPECPMCGQALEPEAVQCPTCGEALQIKRRGFTPDQVRRFRSETRALAGVWAFAAILCAIYVGVFASHGEGVRAVILVVVGACFLACAFQGWRLRAGQAAGGLLFWFLATVVFGSLVGTWEAVFVALILSSLPMLLILVPQAYRCCRFEARLRMAGLPVTVRPEEFSGDVK